jgi:hypothetical protein
VFHVEVSFHQNDFSLSQGRHGVVLNNVQVPKNQQMPVQHMDTIAFASAKYLYSFHAPQTKVIEEPLSKKICLNQISSVAIDKNKNVNAQLGTKSGLKEPQDENLHQQQKVVDFFFAI